jgi:hypothetical protein
MADHSVPTVNMTENMIFRLHERHGGREIRTTMADRAVQIKDTCRWSVGYQDIHPSWNHVPFFTDRPSPRQGEGVTGPIIEQRLPGRSIDSYSTNLNRLILEVHGFGEKVPGFLSIPGKTMIVIAANHYFMPVRQTAQKVIKVQIVPCRSAIGHITGKDQDIRLRDINPPM